MLQECAEILFSLKPQILLWPASRYLKLEEYFTLLMVTLERCTSVPASQNTYPIIEQIEKTEDHDFKSRMDYSCIRKPCLKNKQTKEENNIREK